MSNLKSAHRRAERKKLLFRIGAIILVVLMIGGTIYTAFISLFFSAYAAENLQAYAINSATATIPYISVGIIYGNDSPTSYRLEAANGFVIGSVHSNTAVRVFEPMFTLPQTVLTPARDTNVSKNADGTYSPTNEYYQTKIGAYHIQLSINASTVQKLAMLPQIDAAAKSAGFYAFPAYINGVLYIRVGDFAAYNQTVNSLTRVQHLFANYGVEIVQPSETAVSLIDPATDHVAFEYDCGEDYYMGLTPIQRDFNNPVYIKTPAGNTYEGVFAISRYKTDAVNGITVFNLVDLEGYVEGILPNEISSSWPTEALRTNAIAIRSYALANWGQHDKAYGFDMCTHHCMSYRGRNKVTDSIVNAVSSSAGEVLSYNGKVVNCFFSSSNGGESISPNTAWGGTDPANDIGAARSPWERYSESSHENALWISEVSPSELASYLRSKGYTTLTGDIASIAILEYAGIASGYVKSLLITDTRGNEVTLNTTGKVQTALSRYVNSANFVLGRGVLQYVVDEVQSITATERTSGAMRPAVAEGNYSVYDYFTEQPYSLSGASVFTGSGVQTLPAASSSTVFTATGVYDFSGDAYLMTGMQAMDDNSAETVIHPLDPTTGLVVAETIHNNTLITTTLKPILKTYTAASSGNFIFAGKGWGHGVGLSQWGSHDLGKAGVKAETILELYYPGAVIVDRSKIGW
ncbi:MAG: SpoIID/LytB domain-containing protein [Clostridia bacterium]|nr:SpoIID/LytB domain-containing protein [Clostridia bacterium]